MKTSTLGELYPELEPLLATSCDLVVYRKSLEHDSTAVSED